MAKRERQTHANGDSPAGTPGNRSVAAPISHVPDLFIDGYKNVTLHDLVLRMNLIAHYPSADETAVMETRVVGRLALSLPAFLAIYEGFGSLIKDLEARGMISKTVAGSSND